MEEATDHNSFELWRIVRMFRNRLQRPDGISSLVSFCRRNNDGLFEKNFCERYQNVRSECIVEFSESITRTDFVEQLASEEVDLLIRSGGFSEVYINPP